MRDNRRWRARMGGNRAIGSTAVRWGSIETPIFSKLMGFRSAVVQGSKACFRLTSCDWITAAFPHPHRLKTEVALARAQVSLAA